MVEGNERSIGATEIPVEVVRPEPHALAQQPQKLHAQASSWHYELLGDLSACSMFILDMARIRKLLTAV